VEVAFFLDSLGLGQYGEAIICNGISGKFFLESEDEDLQALGITDKKQRDTILSEIELLR
jgi:hypothetical protein